MKHGTWLLSIIALCTLNVLGQAPPEKHIDLVGSNSLPTEVKYQDGYTIAFHRAHVRQPAPADQTVTVLDSTGAQIFSRNPGFDIPEATMVAVRDATLAGPHQLVVVADSWRTLTPGPDGASMFLYYDLSSRAVLKLVRTNPIACTRVVADRSGNLWCLGGDTSRFKQDYELIYKFSPQGELLGRYFPHSELSREKDLHAQLSSPFGRPQLTVSRDGHVCAWLPNADALVELNSDGQVLARTTVMGRLPSKSSNEGYRPITAGIEPDGTLVRFLPQSSGKLPGQEIPPAGLYHFNRATNAWELITTEWAAMYPPNWLVGADDSGLVIWVREQSKIVWLPQSAPTK